MENRFAPMEAFAGNIWTMSVTMPAAIVCLVTREM